jgi:putative ABC transport system substrate-binding protein
LISLPVDVLVTNATTPSVLAKHATDTVPIVFTGVSDPVGVGLVPSLARPGGNVTGFSILNKDLTGKRLELLVEAYPTIAQVTRLGDSNNPANAQSEADMRAAAEALGVTVRLVDVPQPGDPVPALDAARLAGADALIVATGNLGPADRAKVVAFAAPHHWPAIYPGRNWVVEGGLMSYAANQANEFRRAAMYVDRILRGAKPADLPVEQPMTFDFVVNLKTAQALGITFPNEIMLQVTEVIE